jgi:large subunit ribosomal protein L19
MSEEKKVTEKTALEIKPGMTIKIYEKIKEKNAKGQEKERTQIFEGIVLAHKHNKEIGSTITVRKISDGIGVEKIFPLNSPIIAKIKPVKQAEVRRAKLGYLRHTKRRIKENKI